MYREVQNDATQTLIGRLKGVFVQQGLPILIALGYIIILAFTAKIILHFANNWRLL